MAIKSYSNLAVPHSSIVPGAGIVVQTYGDFLNFNPHPQAIVADGSSLMTTVSALRLNYRGKTWQKPVVRKNVIQRL